MGVAKTPRQHLNDAAQLAHQALRPIPWPSKPLKATKKRKKRVFKIASKNAAFERVVVRGQCGAGTKPVQSR
jgi:hypothetical protein